MLSYFVFVNRFLFYRRTVVVRSDYWLARLFMCTKWLMLLDYSDPEVMTIELYSLMVI